MNIRHHFRRRTPEEDIETFGREPHISGPLGMAVINIAGYYILRPENPDLLVYAGSEAAIATSGIMYVRYRLHRGLARLGDKAKELGPINEKSYFRSKIVPFAGVAAFTGAAQSGLAATLEMLDLSDSPEAIGLGAATALTLGVGAIAVKWVEPVEAEVVKDIES